MSPREVLARHTSRELTEWMAFERIEPFGSRASDERAGVIASTIMNTTPSKSSRTYQPEDIFPRLKDEPPDADVVDDGAMWRSFVSDFQ